MGIRVKPMFLVWLSRFILSFILMHTPSYPRVCKVLEVIMDHFDFRHIITRFAIKTASIFKSDARIVIYGPKNV